MEIRRRLRDSGGEAQALLAWGEVLAESREPGRAEEALPVARNLAREVERPDLAAQADILSSCLLARAGRNEEARGALESALAAFRGQSHRWEGARAYYRFGRALGGEKGRPYLEKAKTLFLEIGAGGWAVLCESAMNP
jgi:hypothetical protein